MTAEPETAAADVWMRHTADTFEVRRDIRFGESRYVEAVADSSRYCALATLLPDGVISGADDGYQLVSLVTPVGRCYPFAPAGDLHIDYVGAQLCPDANDVTRTAVWLLVAHLLDRDPIWHLG